MERFDKETKLPEFWYWENDRLSFTQDWLNGRPLSQSSLKLFRTSPRHYASRFIFGQKQPTKEMLLGKLVEAYIFEKDEDFNKKFQLFEKATGTGATAKNNDALFKAIKANVQLYTAEDIQRAKYCKMAVMDNSESRVLIENKKEFQKKLTWRNAAANIPLIGYLDYSSEAWDNEWLVDFKTANSADPIEFTKQAFNLDYLMQCAAYTDAYKKMYYKFPDFIFHVVETKEPYNVSINFIESDVKEKALDEFYGSLLAFRKAIDEKSFHQGYEFRNFDSANYFSMRTPSWYKPKYGGMT